MSDDLEFTGRADAYMRHVLDRLDEQDPDEVDPTLSQGVLTMEFADGSKCIMNRQTAAHQIWLAHGATAWHFEEQAGDWIDTKGRGPLAAVLSEVLSTKLGRDVKI